MSTKLLFFCLFFLFCLSLHAQEAKEEYVNKYKDSFVKDVAIVKPPAYWDHFAILLWQYKHKVTERVKEYESLNIHGFHIDRSNKKSAALSKEKKWIFYVDHAADKGFLHLGKNAGKLDMRSGDLQVRPNSLASPATLKTMKDYLKTNITNAKDAYPVAYAFDDEISLASFCSAVEVDISPESIAGYRKFLSFQYSKDINKLNTQYGTKYNNFDEISPVTFNAYYPTLNANTIGKLNLSHWCDWRSYMDTQFSDVLKELTHYCNELDPNTPAGFVGGQGPTAFGGYDWRKLSKSVQWVEAYESGSNNEIIRSFWGQSSPLMKTFFPGKKSFESNNWFLWYYMVHGNRGVIVWTDNFFTKTGVEDHIAKLAPTFKEVQGPVSKLIMDSDFQYDKVAIYYSHPSVQITWCLDSDSHGSTWPRRSSSLDNNLSTSHLTRNAWCKSLEDIGIQAKFIHSDHLLDDVLIREKYKVLILNRALALSDEEAVAIKKFVEQGGVVIADHLCGIFDSHGKARKTGVLDSFFGITRDLSKGLFDGNTTTEVDAEKDYSALNDKSWVHGELFLGCSVVELGLESSGSKKGGALGAADIMVEKTNGKGKTIYMNLSNIGYYKIRGDKNKGSDYRQFLASIFEKAGVKARVSLKENGGEPYILEPLYWKKGKQNILAIVRNLSRGSSIYGTESSSGEVGGSSVSVTITFEKEVKKFKDERSGKEFGNGKTFEVDFIPYQAGVFSYEE